MAKYHTLAIDRVRELLDYDALTGEFRWRPRRGRYGRATIGGIAGSGAAYGYWCVVVDGKPVKGHILAWFYTHGTWPTQELDHRNGNRRDNRIANLREATSGENHQNRHLPSRNNRSGHLGISPNGKGWQAQICRDGKRDHLGTFPTPAEASAAYWAAKQTLHPFLHSLE